MLAPSPRKAYHHGNLKQALLLAARQLVAERGPYGFTIVEAARLAGVSAAAPYRHFQDKTALLQELARQGFSDFCHKLTQARAAHLDPVAGLLAMGHAYLAFAREYPGEYQAMFAFVSDTIPPNLKIVSEAAFDVLLDGVKPIALAKHLDPKQCAYRVWVIAHGIASLAQTGRLSAERGSDPEQLLTASVLSMLLGIEGRP
jgi:AcrR family transcriptional regulator